MLMTMPHIQEPMTAVTDLLIAAVSFYAFFRLLRRWPGPAACERWYLWFFLVMGFSTVFGGFLNHAFAYIFPPGDRNMLPNWITNVLSVSCYAMAMVERADGVRRLPLRKALLAAVGVETVAVVGLTLWKMSFLYAEIHIAVVLYVFSLPLQIRLWRDGFRRENALAWAGTAVMSLIPVVLIAKLSFSEHFNFFDISHVIIATAMYLYYRAGLHWREAHPDLKHETTL